MKDEERYDIKGKLGEGGRGSVYLAKDRQLNRTVAIKRLNTDEEEDAEAAYEALLNESRALSSINNPHIVRVFDVCQDEDGPYVVMEHLKGKTLHEVVANAPILEHDFYEIAEQALEALIAAHEVHLLHRDIKPGNLMLTWLPSGRFNLKLLDFGLAKFSAAPQVQTMAHGKSVFGSIYFMAPEQFERKPLDQRTDLYSLGCVFFFALTGAYPFNGANVAEVMASHLQGTHPDLNSLRPDLPAPLSEWVACFIARDPDQRPLSAQIALDSLAAARRGTFTTVAPQPIAPQLATGPVRVEPATAAVHTAGPGTTSQLLPTHTTGHVPLPATGQVPLGTAPTSLKPSRGIPLAVIITMGVMALLVLILGVAVFLRPDPTPPPPSGSGGQAGSSVGPEEQPPAADPPAEEPPPPKQKWTPARTFKNRDKNNDQKLTEAEFLGPLSGQKREEQKKRFRKLDTNKDGRLTFYEYDPL